MAKLWRRAVYRLACLLVLAVLMLSALGPAVGRAETATGPAWAKPTAMAMQRLGPADSGQSQPVLLQNVSCTVLTYRLVNSATMRTGCFTPTAFGLMDSDSGAVIFNGTDEALPLVSYSSQQILAPWPKALNLLTLDPVSTGGSAVSMYKNPLASLQNQYVNGQLTGK
ncbi:MAG TPA: hypothetical protein VM535_00005, partial [Candidatus Saccharimonadales bacterium]|nr:hypothetical protein [Candidatus Saccharimonadales bacterium]